MDLSKLSKDLPPTKPLEQVSLRELNRELTDEFKNAAKAVAQLYNTTAQKENDPAKAKTEFADAAKAVATLYRLSTSSNALLLNKGYLDCLHELSQVIAHGQDVEKWASVKRAEITNRYNSKERDDKDEKEKDAASLDAPEQVSVDFHLPAEHDFSLPPELVSSLHFRPSFAAPSITFRRKKGDRRPDRSRKVHAETSSDAESEESTDELLKKRRLMSLVDTVKRRKRDTSSDDDR